MLNNKEVYFTICLHTQDDDSKYQTNLVINNYYDFWFLQKKIVSSINQFEF